MNADLEKLVMLQAQDLALKRLRQELAEAPRRVAAAEAGRSRAEAGLAAAKQALAKEETLRRSQEVDIAGRRGKIVRLRQQMETATSAAQITALEHEIRFAEEAISELEDAEIASLERSDQWETDLTAAGVELESTTAALAGARAEAASVSTQNTAAIAEIEAERATLREAARSTESGEAALAAYDRIAKAKGTALSEAVDHKCAACQMMVRPQRWNDLTGREHDDQIFSCETCGRMLFHDPRRDAPVRWAAGERLSVAATGGVGSGPKPTASAGAAMGGKMAERA